MSTKWPVILHRNFQRALNKAFTTAAHASAGQCLLITGPTGVGKTEVLREVLDMLVGPPASWPAGEFRYILVECDRAAPATVTRNLVIDLNRALGNPFVNLRTWTDVDKPSQYSLCRNRINEHDLRESFRSLAAVHNTRYAGVDALENILPRQRISGEARFNSVKSLPRSHTKHVQVHELVLILCGHYSLLSYWQANAQLARRVTEVFVAPYRRVPEDIVQWEFILQTVSSCYPLFPGTTLRLWNDLLFDLSVGCIGLLKKLLDDALSEMKSRNAQYMTLDHVFAAAPPRLKLEEVQKDLDGCWPYFEPSVTRDVIEKVKARSASSSARNVKKDAPCKKGRRPGRIAGARDKVGNMS